MWALVHLSILAVDPTMLGRERPSTRKTSMLTALEIAGATALLIAAIPMIEPYVWRSVRAVKRRRRWLCT
jgi:hypothetical protein